MTSRFVSAGAIDAASGEAVDVPTAPPIRGGNAAGGGRREEWAAVQKELDEERRKREEERRKAGEAQGAGGERSLYDVLQANKAAKQAAFEEKTKIKNQFRPLDDDEIDFLDGIRSSGRANEERIRRETEEGLDAFRTARRQREEGGGAEAAAEEDQGPESWAVSAGRKRKREKEREGGRAVIKGLKRQASDREESGREDTAAKKEAEESVPVAEPRKEASQTTSQTGSSPVSKPKLGLADYGSDEDDEDDDEQ